jgi:hypothetical protein
MAYTGRLEEAESLTAKVKNLAPLVPPLTEALLMVNDGYARGWRVRGMGRHSGR